MNKYKEDFDMVTRLCALDGRERTILNYGIEEGRTKAIDEFAEEVMKRFTELELKDSLATVTDCKTILRDVAEKLKGDAE